MFGRVENLIRVARQTVWLHPVTQMRLIEKERISPGVSGIQPFDILPRGPLKVRYKNTKDTSLSQQFSSVFQCQVKLIQRKVLKNMACKDTAAAAVGQGKALYYI